MTRTCKKCGIEKEIEDFTKDNRKKHGRTHRCKECTSEYLKQYYLQNKEKLFNYSKRYREENKERLSKEAKEYYQKNTEAIKERSNKRHSEKRDEILVQRKIYRENNKEKISEQKKESYYKKHEEYKRKSSKASKLLKKNNPEKIKEYNRNWYYNNHEENKKRLLIHRQKRINLMKNTITSLTYDQWEQIMTYFNNECAYCGSNGTLEQEHFVPLSKLGNYDKYNIIPACRSCNSSKGNKNFEEWYFNYVYYNSHRENKIKKYLNQGVNEIE